MDEETTAILLILLVVIAGVAEVLRNDKERALLQNDFLAGVHSIGDWWDEHWLHTDEGEVYQTNYADVQPGTTIYPSMRDAFASTNGATR